MAVRESFFCEIWGCGILWRCTSDQSTNVFSAKIFFFYQFTKVFSLESFPLCGTRRNGGLGAYSSVSGFILWFCCLETSVGYKGWAEDCFWNCSEMVHGMLLSLIHYLSLASQTHFHKRREGSGEQAMSHCTIQCGTITLQYFVT